MLELVKFIQEHPDWEQLLVEKPYCLKITRDHLFDKDLVMFKYSQIDSDFSNEIVKESRGIVLEEGTWEVISYPFRKFGNFGESYADSIDWSSASVQEKIDGSLIKIVRVGKSVLISTNGTIDAFKAGIAEQVGCKFTSFGQIVDYILKSKLGAEYWCNFPVGFTFMFELVSPWTRVVIPYKEPDLYFLGYRNNQTLEEMPREQSIFSKWFKTPKIFSFGTFEDCVKSSAELSWDQEGYVVCDKEFHRVKVKSVAWIQVHHIKDNGNLSYARCLELIRANEIDEVLTYFPEYRDEIDSLKQKYEDRMALDQAVWEVFQKKFDPSVATRKEMALWIVDHFKTPGIAFSLLDGKISSVKDWFRNCPILSLVRMLGLKEPKPVEEV